VCLTVCAQQAGQTDQWKLFNGRDYKFGKHVFRVSCKRIFNRRHGQGHVTPISFLFFTDANSSKMIKATNFKFNTKPKDILLQLWLIAGQKLHVNVLGK